MQRTPGSSNASRFQAKWSKASRRELESTLGGRERDRESRGAPGIRGARVTAMSGTRVARQGATAGVLQRLEKDPVTPSGPRQLLPGLWCA